LRRLLTERYRERLTGVLSCYDRIIVTGTLPGACYAKGMTAFLSARQIRIFDYPRFAEPLRDCVSAPPSWRLLPASPSSTLPTAISARRTWLPRSWPRAATGEDERVRAVCLVAVLDRAGVKPIDYDPSQDQPKLTWDPGVFSDEEREQLKTLLQKVVKK
jgi:hypothetical protein